jgi:hypothetical protein
VDTFSIEFAEIAWSANLVAELAVLHGWLNKLVDFPREKGANDVIYTDPDNLSVILMETAWYYAFHSKVTGG